MTTGITACGDDGGGDGSLDTSPVTEGSGGDGTDGPPPATTTADTGVVDSTGNPGSGTDDPIPPGDELYREDFEGPDGDPWPAPWEQAGSQVISAELDGGRARFSGNTMNVARMVLPGFSETDVDVSFTVTYEAFMSQGVGFYARQNGGALQETNPPGEGYAVFIEGGFMQLLGIWRETNGIEESIEGEKVPGTSLEDGQPYRVRFQCFTEGGGTRLRGRVWPAGEAEPGSWLVDIVDDTDALQGTPGSFAVDVYNYTGTASVYIDDVVISAIDP